MTRTERLFAIAGLPSGGDGAVWARFEGPYSIVQAAARRPGNGFSAPVDLATPDRGAAGPDVAIDPTGDAVAVWSRATGTGDVVPAALRPAGGAFGAPVDLSAVAAGDSARNPRVAVAPGGSAVAVWDRSNATDSVVQAATRPAGGTFGAPVDLSAADRQANFAQVTLDGAGNAVAVWHEFSLVSSSDSHVRGGAATRRRLLRAAGRLPRVGGHGPTPAPVVTRLHLSRTVFRAARSGGSVKAEVDPARTRVSYALSLAGRVRCTVQRVSGGRRVAGAASSRRAPTTPAGRARASDV